MLTPGALILLTELSAVFGKERTCLRRTAIMAEEVPRA